MTSAFEERESPCSTMHSRLRTFSPMLRSTHSQTASAIWAAGFEILGVENLRAHFPPTFYAWLANLTRHWDSAVASAGSQRVRAWQAMLAAGALSCEMGWTGAHHILATRLNRPESTGNSGV